MIIRACARTLEHYVTPEPPRQSAAPGGPQSARAIPPRSVAAFVIQRLRMPHCPVHRAALQDSETYVRNKKKACDEVGINSYGTDLPETATEAEARPHNR